MTFHLVRLSLEKLLQTPLHEAKIRTRKLRARWQLPLLELPLGADLESDDRPFDSRVGLVAKELPRATTLRSSEDAVDDGGGGPGAGTVASTTRSTVVGEPFANTLGKVAVYGSN